MASASSMYAWTDIVTGDGETRGLIKAGEGVKEGDFSEEDWAQLVEARAVRENKYPDMPPEWTGSPREYALKVMKEQMAIAEDALSDDDELELAQATEEEVG